MTMADWSSYFAKLEGAPISIAVDLGLRELVPLLEKPTAYTIAIALREPDEHGMTNEREYRVLAQVEEALARRLEDAQIVQVGRVTGRGMRTFHYYGPDVAAMQQMVSGIMRTYPEYRFKALSAADPTWAIYTSYLFPDDSQLAFAQDMKLLQALMGAGDHFDRARDIEHVVEFDDSGKRDAFARAMANHGYGIAIDSQANAVRCTKRDTIDPFKITEMRMALTTLAEEFGGEYDGWGCEVQQ
jgi:regulator of RNase E activity RraB